MRNWIGFFLHTDGRALTFAFNSTARIYSVLLECISLLNFSSHLFSLRTFFTLFSIGCNLIERWIDRGCSRAASVVYVFLWERRIILKLQPIKPGEMEKIIFYRSNFISKIGSLELVFGQLHCWSQQDMRPASRGTQIQNIHIENNSTAEEKRRKYISSSNKEAKWCVFSMFVILLLYLMVFAICLYVFCIAMIATSRHSHNCMHRNKRLSHAHSAI